MKNTVRNGPPHAAETIRQLAIVISLVTKVEDCDSDKQGNEKSHLISPFRESLTGNFNMLIGDHLVGVGAFGMSPLPVRLS
jgi:hypothetical protein